MKQIYKLLLLTVVFIWTPKLYAQRGATYSSISGGTLAGVPFTVNISDPTGALIGNDCDFYRSSSGAYSALPLPSAEQCIYYIGSSNWTITFESAVSHLRLYIRDWGTMDATFNHPFTILSGANLTSPSANNLNTTQLSFGIIEFTDPVTALTLTVNSFESAPEFDGYQVMTFASGLSISGSCSDSDALGTYIYDGTENGKNKYIKLSKYYGPGVACNDLHNQDSCESNKYVMQWDGTKWVWSKIQNFMGCEWIAPANQCIDPGNTKTTTVLATSSVETTIFPASGGWMAESDGCTPTFDSTLGIEDKAFQQSFSLYPNPTNRDVTIKLKDTKAAVKVRLVNASGQILWTKAYSNTSLLNFKIDAPAGLYVIKIEDEKGQKAFLKLVVSN